jgi:hypothetical protein
MEYYKDNEAVDDAWEKRYQSNRVVSEWDKELFKMEKER